MKRTKLYLALTEIGKIDRLRFTKYIKSEYIAPNVKIQQLAHLIIQSINTGKDLTKEVLWKSLYENPYNDIKLRNLNSLLFKILMSFLGIQNINNNQVELSISSLEEIIDRNLTNLMKSGVTIAEKALKRSCDNSSFSKLREYRLNRALYISDQSELKRVRKKGDQISTLNNLEHNLDLFYLAEKLRLITSALTWRGLVEGQIKSALHKEIIELSGDHKYSGFPPILIYRKIYFTLTQPNETQHFFDLKSLIKNHLYDFPKPEQKEILDSAINYSLIKVNNGDILFLQEIFESYDVSLKLDLLLKNNEITPWTFKNITGVGLRLNKYKWIASFIEEYGNYLPKDYRSSGIALAKAQLEFYQKNFKEVLASLQHVEFKEFGYNTTVKSLQLASYYELDEPNLLIDQAISFKKYLSRHRKLTNKRKDLFKNLIKFTLKLYKVSPRDKEKIRSLKLQIQDTKGLASKTWLLEKVDELLGEKR